MTAPADTAAEALQRALHAVQRMQERLEDMQQAAHEPIAIVGLGCRFPGAAGPDAFLDRLLACYDAVGTVPDDERAAAFAGDDPTLRRAGFLEDVAGFDAGLFDIGDDEAVAMDPHQRLLLETAWAALEDAGGAGGGLAGSRTGVYLGLGAQNSDYSWWLLNDPARLDAHAIPGSFHSLMPGRLSYLLDLRGPSLVVDAACASGLVAVHLACQALRRRECDAAVAAAVNLVLSPLVSRAVQRNGLLSASGTCRSFDDAADGFVRGEGAGALVLKRLRDATADGDAIWAVIHGSAVGQDGRSNGLTAPNGPAQEAVLRQALADARLEPGQVGYVEAHATGTRLGDAIEAQALASVYGGARLAPLLLGALKPNLGHLEAASGMAALVKAVLARRAGELPPTRHGRLNRDIEAEGAAIGIVTEPTGWPAAAPYAGVSAFGMSGTNAHLILGPAPVPPAAPRPEPAETRVLCLGARTETALAALVQQVTDALTPDMPWGDVCATLNLGRKQFPHRCVVEATDTEDGRRRLRRDLDGLPTAPSTPLGIDATAGRAVDWLAAQGRPVRRLRLPTYPFERRRYWPDRVPAASAGATASAPALPDGFLHRVEWQAVPAIFGGRSGGELLLLGDQRCAARVTPGLERAGWRIIRPSNADDWRHLLERRPDAEIVYLVSEPPTVGLAALRAGADAQLGGLLALLQALSEGAPRPLRLVTEGGTGGRMVPAMALALGRTIAIEHADLGCRRIDLDPSLVEPGAALGVELRAGDAEEWVRLGAAGRREVPRVVPLRGQPARFSARADAAYLVTGGFGGVGRAVAGWLVGNGARDIVLMGRTLRDLPDADRWRCCGVRLRMVAADVADPAALAAVLQTLDDDGVPLAGVLHAAGTTSDALLARQDPAGLAAALRAKAEGALVLHEATRGRDLDHFVLFSSITALCGLVGTGAYATANAALGALARRRRAEGLPALAVMWGTWNGSGMAAAADPALAAQWEAHGIAPFDADVGLAALGSLMMSDATEAVAAQVDWARLARWCRDEGSGASLYDRVAPQSCARPDEPAAPAPTPTELERIVRDAVAAVLERSPDDPMLDRPFGELDLGSLAAVELRNRLSARLGLPVPATLAFNHPSVTAVTRFLTGRLAAAGAPEARHVGAMTESEAERRMTALLDEIEAGRVA